MPVTLDQFIKPAGNALATVQSAIPPEVVRQGLRQSPAYVQNRERAAYILGLGLDAYDTMLAAKPWLLYGGLSAAALSAVMLYRRPGPEAKALWTASLVASLVAAYLGSPWFMAAGQVPANVPPQDRQGAGVLASIDAGVAARKAKDPAFADRVWARVASMPGIREQMTANPLLRATVV
jgi:hypothetical protein